MNKLTFKGFLLGATALAVTSMPAVAGQNQDQVIQDLQRQLQALQAEVQTLKSQTDAVATSNREMYRSIRRVEQAATPPKMVTSGKKNVKLAITGQVNRAMLFIDDDTNSELLHVDNANSSTRIRFISKGKLNEDITLGSRLEVQIQSNSSGSVNFTDDNGIGAGGFSERYMDITIDSKSLGKLYLGQGDTASNGTSEVDLSGTGVVSYSSMSDIGAAIEYRTSAGVASGISVGDEWTNMDGMSRDDRVRYDTPTFAGFKLSLSNTSGGENDVALRYKGKFGGVKVAAAAAYANASSTSGTDDQYDGSISIKHDSGFNGTFAAGAQDLKGTNQRDPDFFYVKLGYTGNWFSLGSTALSIDYGQGDDIGAAGREQEIYGFQAVQNVKKLGAQFYFRVSGYELDDSTATSYDDIFTATLGSRIKF